MTVEASARVTPMPDPNDNHQTLRAEIAFYRQMIENVADVLIRGNAQRRRTYVSPAVRDMLGYEPAELMDGGALDLVHPDDRAQAAETLQKLSAQHPQLSLTFRMRRQDGRYIWIEGRYVHLPEDGGVMAVLRDITDRKIAEERLAAVNEQLIAANVLLQELADKDGLTGLANRRCLDRRLEEEWRRARREAVPLGLVLLDIDYFKLYNDHYGHLAGDECLRWVCETVRDTLRRPGDFAARYGGEEIVVLLPGTDMAGSAHMAEQLRLAVEMLQIEHKGNSHRFVTVSAGYCAFLPTDGADTASVLVKAADKALYAAKAGGRNQVRAGCYASMAATRSPSPHTAHTLF